jgi:hypothetical protein
MTRILVPLLAVSLLAAAPVYSKPKKDKPDLPKIFDTAQYVYVEALNVDRDTPDIYSEDDKAISNIREALHDWGRYSLITDRDHADLVLVVHRGRRDRSSPPSPTGPPIFGGGQRPQSKSPFPGGSNDPSNPSAGGRNDDSQDEAITNDDQLAVYIANGSGSLTGPIWMRSRKNGLNAPQLQIFKQLKQDVETAYPK